MAWLAWLFADRQVSGRKRQQTVAFSLAFRRCQLFVNFRDSRAG